MNPHMQKLVEKWAPLLEDLKTDKDIKIMAVLYDNVDRYIAPQMEEKKTATAESKKLAESLDNIIDHLDIDPEHVKLLLDQVSKKRKELPKNFEDQDEWRYVNIFNEVLKFYDSLTCKAVVGIQPMTGPVGLAYALRFRPLFRKDVEDLLGSNVVPSDEETKDEGFKAPDKNEIPEVGLTIEQKEVVAKTRKIKVPMNTKVNGSMIAWEIDDTRKQIKIDKSI